MLNKVKYALSYLILLIIILNCSACELKQDKINDFFAWMNSYIAMPVESKYYIALTYFFEKNKNQINLDNVHDLRFENISDKIEILNFEIYKCETPPSSKYLGYGITINFKTTDKGIFKTNNILITLNNKNTLKYPIGSWVFDVDNTEEIDSDEKYVDTKSSPVVSSNNKFYNYSYKIISSDVKIKRIYFDYDKYIYNENGLPESGRIEISKDGISPYSYIKTKIELSINDKNIIMYDKGCYCGAMNADESVIDLSKKYTEENK